MYTREVTKYSQRLKDGKCCGSVFMDKIELVDFNYKDLPKNVKKTALKNAMKYYHYAIKEMLDNLYFDKKGKVLGSKGTKETLI